MYFFYVDASGNLTTKYTSLDYLYVYGAISLYANRWHGFEKTINRKKKELLANHNLSISLAKCEIKSNWIRIESEKEKHPFLSKLTVREIESLVNLYYHQIEYHHMEVFAVIIDKRHLHHSFDREKLHKKAWEELLEMFEIFLRKKHPKHQGIIIVDDESIQTNTKLAMKHFDFQNDGTSSGLWLKHIVEMPMFTRSELSNGIQLADIIAYSIHRAFRDRNPEYEYFKRIEPFIYTDEGILRGLSVYPNESPLIEMMNSIEKKDGIFQPRLL